MLWIVFALMTGAAVLCALWPLWRRRSGSQGQTRAIAFHKAQLAEIDRDVERGLALGANDFLAKPFTAEALRAIVTRHFIATPPGGAT